ncbi:NAD(P)H-dependent oxidoreductase [Tenacibaculum caenipelagi]|uniref:Nitroreductase n=1 Tax=Tenacibaculum caenipelagi TaxID=1325435 RepID=A0A4R6TFR1_9FLAO|nr:NAD(P)H-dependent oxidoreductase [Tenacibaculum caenipelagi]TDQ27509.1 nitroreductase [Tenacibaculum caenipelagi]
MTLIDNLEWRYATKKFDPSKKVSAQHIELLKRAIQLSPSSYGLQLYKILIIEDSTIKEQLKSVSFGQSQVTDASHVFVFCNYVKVTDEDIDAYFSLKSQIEQVNISDFKGYSDFIKADVNSRTLAEKNQWTSNQTYLAFGNLLNACSELKIDACPMEGFNTIAYNKILGLDKLGLNATVIAAIGYRSEQDNSQNTSKVRKPMENLFIEHK